MSALPPTDGRAKRSVATRAALLSACREMMRLACYRPSMKAVTARAGLSVRSGFQYFGSVEDLWREAIKDPNTFDCILLHVLGDDGPLQSTVEAAIYNLRIVLAVVLHASHAGK